MASNYLQYYRCCGETHRIRIKRKGKKIILMDHPKEIVEREMVVAAMGGETPVCVKKAIEMYEYKNLKWSVTGQTYNQVAGR